MYAKVNGKEKKLEFCREKYETKRPIVQQSGSSLQVGPTPVDANENACKRLGPMQVHSKVHGSQEFFGEKKQVGISSDTCQPTICTTRVAVLAAAIHGQPHFGSMPGIARPCPLDLTLMASLTSSLRAWTLFRWCQIDATNLILSNH